MKNITIAALAAAAFLVPVAANADAMNGNAMDGHAMSGHAMAGHSAPATMLCRPAMAGEKANASMMSAHSAPLVCKEMKMTGGHMMGPSMPADATAQQVDQTWRDYLQSQILIPQGG